MVPKKSGLSRQERLERVLGKLKTTDLGGNRAGFWSPAEGKHVIRILPPVGEMGDFFFQAVGRHTFPGEAGKQKQCYCPSFTSEKEYECPVCDLVNQLYKRGDPSSKELASELRVRKMYWMNIMVRGTIDPKTKTRGPDSGPFMFTPGQMVMTDLAAIISDPEFGDIYDPEEGLDVMLERRGQGLKTEYSVNPRRASSPLAEDQDAINAILSKAKDLSYVMLTEDPEEDADLKGDHALWILPYDRLNKEMGLEDGIEVEAPAAVDEDDEDVEEEEVKPKSKKPVPAARVVDDEDVEEEEVKPAAAVQQRMARRSLRR